MLTAVAMPDMHHGVINTGGITGNGDRSLGDFFSLVVDGSGMAGIVSVDNGGGRSGVAFVRQTAPLSAATAAAPALALAVPQPSPAHRCATRCREGRDAPRHRWCSPTTSWWCPR